MDVTAIPIAFAAGILSLVSPCVLPMIPATTAASMRSSRWGLVSLALGISLAFAFAGTWITYLLLNLGISTEWLRHLSVAMMLVMAAAMLLPRVGDRMSYWLSRLTSRAASVHIQGDGVGTQLLIGASLGLVWLPCVGPTLGTAIALASQGQSMPLAFLVMLSFGLGTAIPLVMIGFASGRKLDKWKGSAAWGKPLLGWTLLLLAVTIITGFDRVLETWALAILPDFVTSL